MRMQEAARTRPTAGILAALAVLCCSAPARCQSTTAPDRSASHFWHVIKRFDFDEAKLGNDGPLPMHWVAFRGPDFPRYAEGIWDRNFGYRSRESFMLKLDGGNVGFRYQPTHAIAISPGLDIRVEAMVHTRRLRHARAVIEIFFTDARRDLVAGSLRRSELVGGPEHNDRWVRVSAFLPGQFESARYVNIHIFLLQPQRWRMLQPAADPPADQITYIDVHGQAWFDDITVYRLPRVSLTTNCPGQLLPPGGGRLAATVSGFAGQPLEAELIVRDQADRVIGHQLWNQPRDDAGDAEPSRRFTWDTGALPAGLYKAQLRLFAASTRDAGLPPLLVRDLTFAQLPDDGKLHPRRGQGFGLVLSPATAPPIGADEKFAARLADEQASMIAGLPVAVVKLPMWRGQNKIEQFQQTDPWIDQLVRRLIKQRTAMVGTFGDVPGGLLGHSADDAGKSDSRRHRTLLDILAEDPAAWRPYAASQLARYAEQVQYWQIGREDELCFALDDRFAATVAAARKQFRTLLTEQTLVVTWPALYAFGRRDEPAPRFPAETANIFLSSRIGANAVGDYLRHFVPLSRCRPWATIESLDESDYDRVGRLADLAIRLVQAASAASEPLPPADTAGPRQPGTVFLPAPWTLRQVGGQEFIEPTEDLLIFRTAADLLGGCRYGGKLDLADNLVGYIFDRGDSTGVLAVHNTGAKPDDIAELCLGQNVERVDLWGNRSAVVQTADKLHRVAAGRLPFFLDNIDPRLAGLRASFALDPPFVPSTYKKHVRSVRFVNTFPMPISGRMVLHLPAGWDASPRIIPFTAQPGETVGREIDIRFPFNAEAGIKPIVADVTIDADRNYRVQVSSGFNFGLGDVTVRTLTQWMPGGELMANLTISNLGDSPLDAFCFVAAPDRPRQERVVANLLPGGIADKSFRIANARELIGQQLRIGLREIKGNRVVNYAIPIR